ncbi:MAG: ATP-binding cassette domain-containing protein [Actinomycetota bacterium]
MSDTAIVMEGVVKRFGSIIALDGLDLEVPTGSVLGLLGPNGAGKTTAVRVLTTIIQPDGGHASVLGHDVISRPEAVRSCIGLAGQYAAVDEILTGRENLQLIGRLTHLPRKLARGRAGELLERFDLAEAADRLAKTYSGGMRRRLDVAAALVHRPPVLFLDEPTTGLDLPSRKELWTVIGELAAEGSTVLLTTQYLEEADRLADAIAVVDHGRVIAQGTAAELKARLGGTVLEVGFLAEKAAARAAELLAGLGTSAPVVEGFTVQLAVADGAGVVIDALHALGQDGLAPTRLSLHEPSLDDVFLSLTGHRTIDDQPAPEGNTRPESARPPQRPAGRRRAA